MIDWIITTFYFLRQFNIINFNEIITNNLFIILICRGFYIITYFLKYSQTDPQARALVVFNKKELSYFILKQIALIFVAMLYFPLTVLVASYSIIISGSYIKQLSKYEKPSIYNTLGSLVTLISPLFGIFWFTLLSPNSYAITAIVGSLLMYYGYGLKTSQLSLSHLIEKYRNRKLSGKPIIQLVLMLTLITLPGLITIGSGTYKPQGKSIYMVSMRDNVHLATDVYFAPGSLGAPRPVILIRTPYGKSGWASDLYLQFYFIQNYHIVIQDLRGTYDSEGGNQFLLFTKSYQDGVDTIEWILDQTWCNGKIASAGVSALCLNQYFYAGMGPEGLKSQSLWFGTPELFDHAIFQGSYHKSSVETWVKDTAPNNWKYQIETIFDHIPKNETMYNSTSLSIPIGPHYSNVSTRSLHVGGWYDHFLQGTLDGYIGYDDYGKTRALGHQKLIMGPWTHGSIYGGQQGELLYPQNSNGFDLIFNWEREIFDESLLGIPANWDDARIAYYIMGDVDRSSNKWNYWRYAYDWPLDHVDDAWYLSGDGGLTNDSIGLINKNFTYLYDPRFPMPNLGGQNQPFDLTGPYDQRLIENRSDVLIFETPTLTRAIETVGRIWGHLYVSSNCTDTDFTVKITDVYPDNRSMLVTDGSLTVRFRDNYTTELFMTGDTNDVYELWVDCWSSAYVFAPDHKIRVAISSSNYPRFAINPNTGVPLAYDYLNSYIANNTLLVGPGYESSIIFPRLVNVSTTHLNY
jgi:uncharacterized protein